MLEDGLVVPQTCVVITTDLIDEAVRLLVAETQPRMVILFGSYARGDANKHSDLDFLVVFNEVKSRRAEMVRLRETLRPLRVPVDVIVVSEQQVADWGAVINTVINEALTEGKVMYEAA